MPNLVSPAATATHQKRKLLRISKNGKNETRIFAGGPGAALVPLLREPGNSRQIYGGEQHLGAEFGGERLSFSAAFW
jgi:hypothetical protein